MMGYSGAECFQACLPCLLLAWCHSWLLRLWCPSPAALLLDALAVDISVWIEPYENVRHITSILEMLHHLTVLAYAAVGVSHVLVLINFDRQSMSATMCEGVWSPSRATAFDAFVKGPRDVREALADEA